MHRYRVLSITSLLVLLLSVTSFYAARSGKEYQLRGTATGYPLPVKGAEKLLIGANAALQQYDEPTLDARLADLAAHGVRYVRQEFRWSDIEATRGAADWTGSDRMIAAARRHGIRVLPVLVTTPAWARAATGSTEAPATETMPPADPAEFASFAGAFAQRYDFPDPSSPSPILAYQIWDEPNLSAQWGDGLINPVGYLNLLRSARSAIRAVNPSALIVLAGLAPTVEQSDANLAPELYLRKLYDAGGRTLFDIVATKPYGFDDPADDRRVDVGVLNFSRAILVREEMVAHGDADKSIWLTQWGWNAPLPGWSGQPSIWGNVNPEQQALYTKQAIQRVEAEWFWAGAMFISTLQPNVPANDAHWGFALLDQQGQARSVYTALAEAAVSSASAPRAQPAVLPHTSADEQIVYQPNPVATFSQGWRFGELGADIPQREDAHVSFTFAGDTLAMIVRRGDYRATMFITIDGKPANRLPVEPRGAYLVLTSPDQLPHIDTIEVAQELGLGEHVADIKIDRGWNQWAFVGWSSKPALDGSVILANIAMPISLILGLLAVVGLFISLPRARWGADWRTLFGRAQIGLWQTALTALVVWLTATLTWAQDAATAYKNLGTPANLVITGVVSGLAFWSPMFVLSLVALVVLAVLVLMRLDIGLVVLAFFIPFYLIPLRLFGKAFPMVEILTFLCVLSWAVRHANAWRRSWHERRNWSLRTFLRAWTPLDVGIAGLLLVGVLSTSQANFKVEAARELRMVLIEPAILYVLLRTTTLEERQAWRITDGFVVGAIAVALIGLVNYARGYVFPAEFGLPRIRSVYGSPNNDALYLSRAFAVLLPVVLLGLSQKLPTVVWTVRLHRLLNRRLLYAIGLIVVTLAIVLSQSRGALLIGIPAIVVVVCLLAGGRWKYLGLALLALVAGVLLVLLSGIAAPQLAGTRFANALDLTSGTGFFRVNLWQSALRMWGDHPILGVGPDNFLYAYRGYYMLPAAWQEPSLSHPHNIVLDFADRLGTLGLLSGLLISFGIFKRVRQALKSTRLSPDGRVMVIGIMALMVNMVAHGMVDNAFFLVDLAYAFMLACGLLAVVTRYGNERVEKGDTKP